jgi:N-acetylglucosaminyldiphosphoundecaprenol N-acetyl-beta-D-mannosaminyltransferase
MEGMERVRIVGLPIDPVSMESALGHLETYIAEKTPRHVVTADASMAVIARRDPDLRAIVERADLVTPDGFGILWAARLLRLPIAHKVSGVDLVGELCRLSSKKGYRLFFLGAGRGVADQAAENLRARYPGAQIVGTNDGFFLPEANAEVVARIAAARPDVVLVAFGIPRQEKWITKHKEEIGASVYIGIGGSFDVYSGLVKRAPVWMQNHGLEWLYRLCANPKKIKKVMTLPRFALLALRQRYLPTR